MSLYELNEVANQYQITLSNPILLIPLILTIIIFVTLICLCVYKKISNKIILSICIIILIGWVLFLNKIDNIEEERIKNAIAEIIINREVKINTNEVRMNIIRDDFSLEITEETINFKQFITYDMYIFHEINKNRIIFIENTITDNVYWIYNVYSIGDSEIIECMRADRGSVVTHGINRGIAYLNNNSTMYLYLSEYYYQKYIGDN